VPHPLLLAAGLAFALPGVALAQGGAAGARAFAPSVAIGTTGLGIDLAAPLAPGFGLRLSANAGRISLPRTVRGTRFDVGVDLGGVGVMLDYAPQNGALFVTGGLWATGAGFSAYRDDVGYRLVEGGQEYIGEVGFDGAPRRSLAPVLGVGWRSTQPGTGWRIAAEAGVIVTGRWRGSVDADTDIPMLGGLAQRFRNELAEANKRLNDRLADLPALPYLRLSVERRF
jgi:hypothetical protein